MENIDSYFDILTVINRINEIEKLKRVFLTHEQMTLFHIGMDDYMCICNDDFAEKKEQDEDIKMLIDSKNILRS